MNFRELQEQHAIWAERNFGETSRGPRYHQRGSILGVTEEVGELADHLPDASPHVVELVRALGRLAHATLKGHEGIRGPRSEHEAKAQDAVADITIFLADLCWRNGWDYQQVVEQTWAEVSLRDWRVQTGV